MHNERIEEGIAYAQSGDIDNLKKWLTDGNNPNQYDKDGWTPLLWASVRGNSEAVEILLNDGADSSMPQNKSGSLPIHLAGHSGDVKTAQVLLDNNPGDIDAVWDLNGHTVLLQASFYGHLELADFLVKKGANTSITTARGLGPMEMAEQFQNYAMMDIIRPYDSSSEEKAAYYRTYLTKIAPTIPENEKDKQELSDKLVAVIESGIKKAFTDPLSADETMKNIKELVEVKKADVNRLGGPLQQPPLIVAVTGNNGNPAVKSVHDLRIAIAGFLLNMGADPVKHEMHPMGAQTIIRASVFNHLEILKMCAQHISAQALADAINEIPAVNGLTALHDSVLRCTMAGEDKFDGYLAQCRWLVENGGKSDIPDFSGVTQKNIAQKCKKEQVRSKLLEIL